MILANMTCAQYITGWRSVVKWIYHECEARVIYSMMTDRRQVICWTTNQLLARLYFEYTTQ